MTELTNEQATKITEFINNQLPEEGALTREEILASFNPEAFAQYVNDKGLDGAGYRPE